MRTALFLVFTFIKEGLKTTKVKSTACSSKKIKTYHQIAFCATQYPSTLKLPSAHVCTQREKQNNPKLIESHKGDWCKILNMFSDERG